MERLLCKALLWKAGLITCEAYNETLNELFLKNTEDDLLLELESYTLDSDTSYNVLHRYWEYECKDFSADVFGKYLLDELKAVYQSNAFPLKVYGKKCFRVWRCLPDELQMKEPFHILSYADDPLSWGDESASKKIFEELFGFYK